MWDIPNLSKVHGTLYGSLGNGHGIPLYQSRISCLTMDHLEKKWAIPLDQYRTSQLAQGIWIFIQEAVS